MAKVYFIINLGATNKDGRHPINLRVCDRSKVKSFTTGFYSLSEDWDKSANRFKQGSGVKSFNVIRRQADGFKQYTNKEANTELALIESRAQGILDEFNKNGVDWSMEMFAQRFEVKRIDNKFLEYARTKVIEERLVKLGKFKSAQIMEAALHDLELFDPNIARLEIKDIDKKFLSEYVSFCEKRGNQPNTISVRIRSIRRILNLAIEDKVGSAQTYPFGKNGVKIPANKTAKRFLTMDSLRKVAATTMENPATESARHLFLFSFYCRGINYKDMAALTAKNIDSVILESGKTAKVIRYRRSKTSEDFEIIVTPAIQRELDWFEQNDRPFGNYLLPIVKIELTPEKREDYLQQRRKRWNRQLRTIARTIGIPEADMGISAYWARHSFAMAMLGKGESIDHISQALGHQDIKTTKVYLKSFSSEQMAQFTAIDLD